MNPLFYRMRLYLSHALARRRGYTQRHIKAELNTSKASVLRSGVLCDMAESAMDVYRGTAVHCVNPKKMEVLPDHLIGVENGQVKWCSYNFRDQHESCCDSGPKSS